MRISIVKDSLQTPFINLYFEKEGLPFATRFCVLVGNSAEQGVQGRYSEFSAFRLRYSRYLLVEQTVAIPALAITQDRWRN